MLAKAEIIIVIPWDGGLGVVYESDGKGRAHAGIRPEDWPRIERAAKAGKLMLRGGQEVQDLFRLAQEQRARSDVFMANSSMTPRSTAEADSGNGAATRRPSVVQILGPLAGPTSDVDEIV
jgi:hypothetical protein